MATRKPMLALRFISGKYEGGEFPLRPDREIRIGRQADFEMVLVEDMVSRKHARIMTHDDQITIEDLGSTNGTFINGQKVKHSPLEEGDRVLIGTSLLRVVRLAGEGRSEKEVRDDLSSRAKRSPVSGRFSGSLADVPLPDLLQLLTTGKKTGALRVDGPAAGGAVHVREGRIIHSDLDDLEGCPPKKALFRMLGWADGSFELQPTVEVPGSLDEPTEGLLLDAMREIDELRRIADTLPGEEETLLVPMPLQPPLRDLQPEELEVLQAAMNTSQVGLIVDQTPLTDYEAWRILVSLIERGYLVRQ